MIPISISPFFTRVFFARNGCLKQGRWVCLFVSSPVCMVGNGFAIAAIPSPGSNEQITAFWGQFWSVWIFSFENLNPYVSLFAFCHLSWKTLKTIRSFLLEFGHCPLTTFLSPCSKQGSFFHLFCTCYHYIQQQHKLLLASFDMM